ncbi:probable pectinesterase/pectinesterase inhibitor 41 [Cajanus cajan]|uniref:Pectinesterase n=1 Tax=Cajanus cajan TaxID=3821 RepID=A0A151S854_CAJCA|nr:probable pectinesterase/pectinesterase inhibitor 41 [Cajanus cajan]KYP50990.1 putative pectinesterase/pectinesterase inhibitor 41 [Cajanus cajan]
MASNLCYSLSIFLILLITASADSGQNLSTPVSPGTACKSTPDPSFCKSVLPPQNDNVYDYGRFSVKKSLSQARKFLNLVDKYLQRASSLSAAATRALQDCRTLGELNFDFLSTSFQTVNKTTRFLPSFQAQDIQTLLSAILTNQQTCLDGLKDTASAWSVRNGLTVPLSNDTKLYTVSLALFTKAWVPKTKPKPNAMLHHAKLIGFRNGRLPLKMSTRTRAIYESVSRRKLLQASVGGEVNVSDIVTVSQDGSGNFTTISDAIAAAPNKSVSTDGYFLIYVTAGVYQENVSIDKKKTYLMMVGDGINKTIITGNRSVVDGWTTFSSATLAVVGQGFVGVNMTIRNTAGAVKHQAVALRNGADLSTFYSCSFEGYQDTLYVHSMRQFYRECDIYGTVDFIFGNAKVVFQSCNMYPRLPMSGQFNAITAQGRTDPNQDTGISIHNCTVRAADDLAASNGVSTYLGRPWKEYSRTVFMQSFMDSVINGAGWREWDGDFALSTLYYAEFGNSGAGSSTANRVTWPGYHVINATDAANFTVSSFLLGDDWLPQTGVTYTDNLL